MARACICFVFFVLIFSRIHCEMCILRTESGEFVPACCADFEENGKNCIACSRGYTSIAGQNCRPCPNNTYGERCRYDCYCTDFQICNIVEGCVEVITTTGILVPGTSDDMTTHMVHDESSNGNSSDDSVQVRLSTEMIFNITLSVVVVLFGVCLCFIFYKYDLAAKWKRPTFLQSAIPQNSELNHSIEIEDRLYHEYTIINEADMLDDHHLQQMQMQMSSDYLDVIRSSNSTMSSKSKVEVNHDFQYQDPPSAGTKKYRTNDTSSSRISGDTSSLSGEENQDTTNDYLNPYQPLIKVSPSKKEEYLTIATVERVDINSPYSKIDMAITNESVQPPIHLEMNAFRQLYEHENSSIKLLSRNAQLCLSFKKGSVSMSCDNLNMNSPRTKIFLEKEELDINSTDTFRLKCKSESNLFSKYLLMKY